MKEINYIITTLYVTIISFFDRNWNLLLYKRKCFKISFRDNWFRYNDMASDGVNLYRCLGKGWYKITK